VFVTADESAECEYRRTPWLASAVYVPLGAEARIPEALETLARTLASIQRGATALVVLEPAAGGIAHY
jgi:hypothetical protein